MPDRSATVEIARIKKNGQFFFRLLSAGVAYDEMLDYSPLDLAELPPCLDSPANVEAYGTILRNALCGDAAVRSELEQIFLTTPPDRVNLRFWIGPIDAEQYRWETLCVEASRFLAVSGQCSMRRHAGVLRDTIVRVFELPIRIGAFLSPVGITSENELRAIAEAVCRARDQGLAIEATFYVGEQTLLDRVAGEVARGELPGVRIEPIPGDAIALEKALRSEPYQFVHFFCHGRLDNAHVQLLEFASINDHDDDDVTTGSVVLSIERLTTALALQGVVWSTVLNSCSSATQPLQLESMARLNSMARALAQSASPITVGMAEPIKETDATLFAEGFYERALEVVRAAVEGLNEGAASVIDLGPAVAHGRTLLHQAGSLGQPNGFSRWCLPIHYESATVLKVIRNASPQVRERAETVAQALRGLSGNTPNELRDQILALLDKDPVVPPALRPDRFGNFA